MRTYKKDYWYIEYTIEDGVVILEKIEIKKDKRGQWLWSELLKEWENNIEEEGYKRIELCAYPQDNETTLEMLKEFYENNWYEIEYDTGTEILFYKDL